MIASTDTALVLFDDCKRWFGLDTYLKDNEPEGEVLNERIIIFAKPQKVEKIWKKNFVEVNLCVPDGAGGEAGSIRLQELERSAHSVFDDGVTGTYDGDSYCYTSTEIGIEQDTRLRCHYVNVRILFSVLNV